MIVKTNNQWSGKALHKKTKDGSVNFDSYIQRNYVWDNARNSLFIHSILTGYPIPPFYAVKEGDHYSMLDGKQRSNAISSFMDDSYLLVLDEDYREIDGELIEGKKYSELSEELQDRIKDVSLTVYFFDDSITDDEIEEMFFRLNNGKPLTAIELTRVRAKSFDVIKDLSMHELFTVALSEKAIQKYNNEAIVMNAYITIYDNEPSYTTKYVREVIQSADITAEQKDQIAKVFNKILKVYQSIQNSNTKVAKKMLKKTHLLSLTKLASTINESELRDFVQGFFAGTGRSASISERYNSNCQYGSAKPESVAKRLSEMQMYYEDHILGKTTKEETKPISDEVNRINLGAIPKHQKTQKELEKEKSTEELIGDTEKEFEEFGLADISKRLDEMDENDKKNEAVGE
jgi:uncharacterized lipoprotein YehR (DUF1307 family)